jgi:hypothetical protein
MGVGLCAGLIGSLLLLVRFFVRQGTMTVHIAPSNDSFSFWMEKKNEAALRRLVNEATSRKSAVSRTMTHPARSITGEIVRRPMKWPAGLALLLILSAFMTENPLPLLAATIPVAIFLRSVLLGRKEPPLFRQARRHFHRREWQHARELVARLIRDEPEYTPARLLLFDLLLQLEDFDGAEDALSGLQGKLDDQTLERMRENVSIRARISERKKQALSQPVC